MDMMKVQLQNGLNLTHRRLQRGHLLILLQLLVLASLVFPSFALPTARAAEVPNVVGSPQASAESAISNASLIVGRVIPANSATVPIGDVISQDPAAGINVVPGSPVDLVVSGVAVPNVVGLSQTQAQLALSIAGLTVGTGTTANSATVPIGNVISQSPVAGTNVFPGNPVALVVSLGAMVPNVVGLTQAAAQTAIITASLTVGSGTKANSGRCPSARSSVKIRRQGLRWHQAVRWPWSCPWGRRCPLSSGVRRLVHKRL